jgi:hypothetical protein
MDRLAQAGRPDGRPAGFQRWRTLLFLHWEVPAEALAALLPPGLTVDTFEGRAYLGLVPFLMRDVSPWWSPSVPGVSTFPELNLRTYVHSQGRGPGVWFFSLDAAKLLVVLAARTRWRLPYSWAAMSLDVRPDRVRYRSRRRCPSCPSSPSSLSANFEASYRIGDALGTARPGSFEHFLTERYLLYTTRGDGGLVRGQVHHRPYPLHRAELLELHETVVDAAGLPTTTDPPHVLFSPGVDVDIYPLRPTE